MPSTRKDRSIPDTPSSPQAAWSAFVRSRLILTDGISPHDTTGAPARVQEALDAELSALHLAMCAVRARRNALSPISILPAEVLLHIFQFASGMCPFGEHEGHRLGWVAVTHVCRRWRDAALESPCLWRGSIGSATGYEWLELVLARTKAIPISISWLLNSENGKMFLDLVSRHFHHLCDLSLWAPAAVLGPFLSSQSFSDGILESLDLDGTWEDHDNFVAPELPATMVGARLPTLREVRLVGFSIPWSAPILCNLTHLKINMRRTVKQDTAAISELYNNSSYDELLSALQKMANLRVLHLQHCLPVNSGPATLAVGLPQLESLFLEGASKPCFDIFRQLTISPACRLCLCCAVRNAPAEDISGILPALTKHFGTHSSGPPFAFLELSDPYEGQHRLEAWRVRPGSPDFSPQAQDFSILLPVSAQPQASLRALCEVLPLHAVQEIAVAPADTQMPCLSPAEWRTILRRCAKVTQVQVKGCDAFTVCAALAPPLETRDAVGTRIEHLEIEDADFTASSDMDGVSCLHWDVFTRWLLAWREAALPLPTLGIADCPITPMLGRELEDLTSGQLCTRDGTLLAELDGGDGGDGGDGDGDNENGSEHDQDDEDQGDDEDQDGEDENQGDEDQDDEGEGGDLEEDAMDV